MTVVVEDGIAKMQIKRELSLTINKIISKRNLYVCDMRIQLLLEFLQRDRATRADHFSWLYIC